MKRYLKWFFFTILLLVGVGLSYNIYSADLFISPETMAERVIKDTSKAPEVYQEKLDEMMRLKREREAMYSDLTFSPTYNMTISNKDNIFYRAGSDAAIVATIHAGHVDKWGHDRPAIGLILMRMNKRNLFQQWNITEILFVPIEEGRTSWSIEDFK